jgi:hypothetical protein
MKFSDEDLSGVVYDLPSHGCIFNSYDHSTFGMKEEAGPLPWQFLETALTAWIETV